MSERRPWSDEETAILIDNWAAGHSGGRIALKLGRSRSSVMGKLTGLGMFGTERDESAALPPVPAGSLKADLRGRWSDESLTETWADRKKRKERRMTVRLIAISQPAIEGVSTPGDLLAYCARVSSTANQMNHDTGPKLIRSLPRRKEWSPLEMVSLTMEIETTRDIARQILRHRSFAFQEFSQRYAAVVEPPVYREGRMQHPTDRQASIVGDDQALENTWQAMQHGVVRASQDAYRWALENGIAKEQARSVLPEGMTPSRLYVAGTLRSWWHYTDLRMEAGTQAEHRAVATAARDILYDQFPMLKDET